MRITILFGGTNKERLVSVASRPGAASGACLKPICGSGTSTTPCMTSAPRRCSAMRGRSRMNSSPATAASALEAGARQGEGRGSRAGARPARRPGGERRIAGDVRDCAAFPSPAPARRRRISPSTRWRPSASRRSRASTAPAGVALEDLDAAFAEYGKLIAKPARDGSSYGLIFVNAKQDLVAVRNAAKTEEYLIEPFVAGVEATCGVLEQSDGSVLSLPPIEIVPARGRLRLHGQISAQIDPGDLPRALCARNQRANHGSGAARRTGRCRAAAIRGPTSSSRRRGRSTSKPTPCRA